MNFLKNKKFFLLVNQRFFIIYLCVLLLSITTCLGPDKGTEKETLRIFHFNDVYQILSNEGYGGLAEISTLIKEERSKSNHHLTTFGGDLFPVFLGDHPIELKTMIELMNLIKIDVAVLGNHEFDLGSDYLLQAIQVANYPLLAGNVRNYKTGNTFSKNILLKQIGNFKIGFFSLIDARQ